jgi:long-chain fatty acid transport protein
MSSARVSSLLRVGGAAGFACIIVAEAHAGGFAIREQSACGQGASFAGVAAGGCDISSMFWNPATMTQFAGAQVAISASGIFGSSKNSPDPTTPLALAGFGGTGNTAESALVPGSYFSYQVSPNFWVGMSVNAPFGLSVDFPGAWAGMEYAAGGSHLRTYMATPSIAWQINNWISVGAGVQIMYADAGLTRNPVIAAGPVFGTAHLEGNGWGYGFTAGVTLTPTPTTTIGLGYRSAIDLELDGTIRIDPLFSGSPVNLDVKLPDIVSLGIRQQLGPQWTLLGTVEWSHWSRIGTSVVNGSPVPGGTTVAFEYDDGWFFALGAEYRWNPVLTLRAGLAYEISPVTDDVRTPLVPDNDRIWLSAGFSYNITQALKLDFAYSHIFVKDAPVNIVPGHPAFGVIPYSGTVESHVDIVTVGLSYSWGAPEPVRKTALVTK